MSITKLWRKPTPAEVLESLIASTKAELETAQMQEMLAKAKLNTASQTVVFYQQHLEMLVGMAPTVAKSDGCEDTTLKSFHSP